MYDRHDEGDRYGDRDRYDEPALTSDERTWGLFAHLAGLAGNVVPFGSIIGPIVVWKTKGEESGFVADQAKESLNFQITMIIAILICIPLVFVIIGAFLIMLLGVLDLVFVIIGMIRANEGIRYRYPICIRFVK
jgi:uncharacterized Tic20 family protein